VQAFSSFQSDKLYYNGGTYRPTSAKQYTSDSMNGYSKSLLTDAAL